MEIVAAGATTYVLYRAAHMIRKAYITGQFELAVLHGKYEDVERLFVQNLFLSRGRFSKGRSILHIAVASERPDIVRFLLEQGVDQTITDRNGKTAEECAWDARYSQIIRVFVDYRKVKKAVGKQEVEMENTL